MNSEPRKDRHIRYVASATLRDLHDDDISFVRGVMGPLGSGKSVAMCMEIFDRCMRQTPDRNGRRRSRWGIVRNTYPELLSTTIKTWKEWVPEELVPFIRMSPPITAANYNYPHPDGKTAVEMEFLFLALDKPKDVRKLLSNEFTGIWYNEAREISKEHIDAGTGRVGRFPPSRDFDTDPNRLSLDMQLLMDQMRRRKRSIGENIEDIEDIATEYWSGIIMDTNPPDDDHWWYKVAEEEKPPSWRFFQQPPALLFDKEWKYEANVGQQEGIAAAENIENLKDGFGYYTRQLSAKTKEWIKVYTQGKYGTMFDGKPVYKDVWDDSVHVSAVPLKAMRGVPLILGFDFGLTPACIVGQMTPQGSLMILREYVCTRGAIRQFARETVIPALSNEFDGIPILGWGDPAGKQASQVDEVTCFGELKSVGLPCEPAPTNDLVQRRGAVVEWLSRMVMGKPSFLLDPSCSILRKGFNGGYHFSRVQISGADRYRDVPNKNAYSHPHDALQYLCLGAVNPMKPAPVESSGTFVPQENTWGAYV